MRKQLLIITALALAPRAENAPERVRSIDYVPDQVVALETSPGFALVVEFPEDEHVDSVVVGDSAAWDVTPTKRGDRLVIRSATGAADTNLVVATDERRYVFLLHPTTAEYAPFVIHLRPPQRASIVDANHQVIARYRLRGAKSLLPTSMTDDGHSTSIEWPAATPLPAIAAVDGRGRESIVNGRMVNGAYLLDGTASRYVFRRDTLLATAERDVLGAKSR